MPEHLYISETIPVEDDGVQFFVRRVRVGATPVVRYSVWERDEQDHTQIRHGGELGWLGAVMSRSLPGLLADIPGSEGRHQATLRLIEARQLICHRLIERAVPDVMDRPGAEKIDGDICTREAER